MPTGSYLITADYDWKPARFNNALLCRLVKVDSNSNETEIYKSHVDLDVQITAETTTGYLKIEVKTHAGGSAGKATASIDTSEVIY